MSEPSVKSIPASAYADPRTFREEQVVLRAATWQLFGTTDELADGNECRRSVLGLEVVVARRGGEVRATWGRAPVRLELLGRFVFVTLADPIAPLRDYLGSYANVLEAASIRFGRVLYRETEIARANWKHCVEISHDDYHAGAVHPTTFGAGTPLALHQYVYRRDGMHSCYLKRRDADWQFDGFWRDVQAGQFDQTGYKIFNLFPNALLASMGGVMCGVSVYTPIDRDCTALATTIFEWQNVPIAAGDAPALIDYVKTFLHEDRVICEGLQESATQRSLAGRVPVLGKLEARIAWFQESYLDLMNAERA